ncbi:MAG: phosphopantetheine-binding protein, partial [Candidatus Saccharimonadales bacterium]
DPQTLRPLPDCQVGEVWLSGPSVGGGYWNRPRESAETFAARLEDGEGPFLRTGDLGFLDGGELFITGRLKDLIILQGRNHYPHDIEQTAAESHPALKLDGGAAFSVDVSGQERVVVVQEVMRPRKVDLPAVAEILRARIAESHSVSVSAICLIPAGTLPKTSSGKTRRRACREFFLSGSLGAVYEWRERDLAPAVDVQSTLADPNADSVQPRTATEGALAQIWSEVLGLASPDIHTSFFDVGGQSLLASQLAARVQAVFGVELPIRVLFESPTIARLAAWLDGAATQQLIAGLPPVSRADRAAPLPLSSFQEQLWFLEQLEPEPRYLLSATVRLRGPLDEAALERSLRAIVERHEALRTVFPVVDGQPAQVVHEVGRAARSEFQHLANKPFEAARSPLAAANHVTACRGYLD